MDVKMLIVIIFLIIYTNGQPIPDNQNQTTGNKKVVPGIFISMDTLENLQGKSQQNLGNLPNGGQTLETTTIPSANQLISNVNGLPASTLKVNSAYQANSDNQVSQQPLLNQPQVANLQQQQNGQLMPVNQPTVPVNQLPMPANLQLIPASQQTMPANRQLNNQQPIYLSQQPNYNQQQPILLNPQPNYNQQQALLVNPQNNPQQGILVYPQANANNQQSILVSQQPNLSNQKAIYVSPQPNVNNQQPIYLNQQPNLNNQQPIYLNQQPNQQPNLINQQPIYFNQQPNMNNQQAILVRQPAQSLVYQNGQVVDPINNQALSQKQATLYAMVPINEGNNVPYQNQGTGNTYNLVPVQQIRTK